MGNQSSQGALRCEHDADEFVEQFLGNVDKPLHGPEHGALSIARKVRTRTAPILAGEHGRGRSHAALLCPGGL